MQEIGKSLIKIRLHRLKNKITGIVISLFCCGLISCAYAQQQDVRVQVFHDASSLSLKIRGTYEIIDSATLNSLRKGKVLKTTVTVYKDKILLAGAGFKARAMMIKTSSVDEVEINGRVFRGDIELIRHGALLDVINHIGLEDYVKGISVRETSHYWPSEILKAQAIVFRTYALYKMQERSKKDFDLTSDIYSQAYGGVSAERYRINSAVDETKGKVLAYQGKIFPAFYHATCAGHTERASLVWNIDLAPLKGVACAFCQGSPHFSWHYVVSLDEIKAQLVKAGYQLDSIEEIAISGRDESGRIIDLKFSSHKGVLTIPAKDFRNILGPNLIRSTNFSVSIDDTDAVFEGFGWGHGVGLCQWGGYFKAKEGYKFDAILQYYYPGAKISSDAAK